MIKVSLPSPPIKIDFSCHYNLLEFLCLGGWEQDIPYNTLPGVTANEDNVNFYSANMFENENRRVTEYGTLNYYTEQEEDMVNKENTKSFWRMVIKLKTVEEHLPNGIVQI